MAYSGKVMDLEYLPDKSFFRLQKWACRFVGLWPMDAKSPPFFLYMHIFALFFNTFGEAWYGLTNLDNLKLSVDAIAPFGTEGLALFKIILVAYDRKKYGVHLKQLYSYFKNGKTFIYLNWHNFTLYTWQLCLHYILDFREKTRMHGHVF